MAYTGVAGKDVSWNRLARRFEAVFGYGPSPTADLDTLLRNIALRDPVWADAARSFIDFFGYAPTNTARPSEVRNQVRAARPQPTPDPSPPTPTPDPETDPNAPEPIDYRARAGALYPWLPAYLLDVFASRWADSGDASLALAETRADASYAEYFPGIRRSDGSLRMSEQEWFATREAYGRLLNDFGLNASVFEGRYTELMEGDVSPAELAGRLGGAYEQIINNIPEARQAFAEQVGIEATDQAVFAFFIDPEIGDALLSRQISVAQISGEGLARNLDVSTDLAGRLASGGLDQAAARTFFADAEGRLSTLDDLVRRHRDPDDTFDLEEYAEANVFGDAAQNRRIQRVLRSEASLFTDRLGSLSIDDEMRVSGLTAR